MDYYMEKKIDSMNLLVESLCEDNYLGLVEILMERDRDLYAKHDIPKYASRLLLYYENKGLSALTELVNKAPGSIYPGAILECLFCTMEKKLAKLMFVSTDNPKIKMPQITNEMSDFASQQLHELVAQSLENKYLFSKIMQFLFIQEQRSYGEESSDFIPFVFKIFSANSIKLNQKIINEFEVLVSDVTSKEEVFQLYLGKHPVMIDPLAKEIIPKQKLGSDYITDFVIRNFNDEYTLVEIEKPSTPIFNKSNDFTAHFSHALGQVLDFQEWVESNIAYAQTLMPRIISPKGLLIIGQLKELTETQRKKLQRFNINNQGKVKVMTFDELINNSRKLYSNMVD